MKITTTPSFEGTRILKYCGFVAGEVIFGANLFKDLFAKIRDNVGGRASGYEATLQDARESALRQLWKNATEKGANAIVGVALDYHSIGTNNSMLMVCATGTAVVIPEEGIRASGRPRLQTTAIPPANPLQKPEEKPLQDLPAAVDKVETVKKPATVFNADFSISPKSIDTNRLL